MEFAALSNVLFASVLGGNSEKGARRKPPR